MQELLEKLNKEIALGGIISENKAHTVGALLDAHLQVIKTKRAKKQITFKSVQSHEGMVERWKAMPAPIGPENDENGDLRILKDFPCAELTREMVAGSKITDGTEGLILNLVDNIGEPLHNKTIGTYLNVLAQAYELAPELGWCHHNPAAGIKLETPKWENDEEQIREGLRKPTMAQVCKIIDAALAMDRDQGANAMRWCDGLAIAFCALTGPRFGEQAALRWTDITWPRDPGGEGEVRFAVAQRMSEDGKVEVGGLKNTRGSKPKPPRYIPLDPELCTLLREWREITPRPGDNDLIFQNEEKYQGRNYRGKPIEYEDDGRVTDSKHWRENILHPACEEAGLEPVRFHDLRHYYASMLIDEFGGDFSIIQRRMGHTRVSFTIDTYGNWVDQTQREVGSATRMMEARNQARSAA